MKSNAAPLAVYSSGMVSSVGYNAPACCAALRCEMSDFGDTQFIDAKHEPICGAQVHFENVYGGINKLAHMAALAIRECVAPFENLQIATLPVILCMAESERPGRTEDFDTELFSEIEKELGTPLHRKSAIVHHGRASIATAMQLAATLIYGERFMHCVIVGTDSLLWSDTITTYLSQDRIKTDEVTDGSRPSEASAALLIGKPRKSGEKLICIGIGESEEPAPILSEKPLRGDGLFRAMQSALRDAQCDISAIDYRISDANGEPYFHKEETLAMTRISSDPHKPIQDWHPAQSLGEVGAAFGPCALALALAASRKNYAPGAVGMLHLSGSNNERAAIIFQHKP